MLTDLMVEGLGVIDRAELQLTPGSSALTGETGAGKTLLVAALGLLLGARSDRSIVRQGSPAAVVDARFVVARPHPVIALLEEHGLTQGTGTEVELVLSRSISADGRSKARINGRLVTVAILQDAGRSLVEIAGQNEPHELGAPGAQKDLLDKYAGAGILAQEVAVAIGELGHLKAELAAARSSERDRARELDVLAYEIKEIEEAALRTGEIDELARETARLEHADVIATAIGSATQQLKGDGGVGESLAAAHRVVETLIDKDPETQILAERLRGAAVEVADIAEELGRRTVAADPVTLASGRERLGMFARLLKKYGATEDDVIAYLQRAKRRAGELDASGLNEERIEKAIEVTRQRAETAAQQLSLERQRAARELTVSVEAALADLALGDARFKVELEGRDLYAGGSESVAFLIAANVGEAPKPLSKVASGGELSRIALVLRLLTGSGTAATLVFDEVDSGVGGEAARAVGRYLAELGDRAGTQVLVVTHLPQVAAFADHQYRVSKMTTGGRTASLVERVEGDDRVEELSRMLAGLPESERAREHAQELLELAFKAGER